MKYVCIQKIAGLVPGEIIELNDLKMWGLSDKQDTTQYNFTEHFMKLSEYTSTERDQKINEILTPDDIKKSWITSEYTSEVDGFPVGTWMIEFEPKIN